MLKKIRKIATVAVLLVVVFGIFIFASNIRSYYRPWDGCDIALYGADMQAGRAEMKSAISHLKNKEPQQYKNVCRYVNQVTVDYCRPTDFYLNSDRTGEDWPSCHIKGTGVVYISPRSVFDVSPAVTARVLFLESKKISEEH